jgi:hypothetical protein
VWAINNIIKKYIMNNNKKRPQAITAAAGLYPAVAFEQLAGELGIQMGLPIVVRIPPLKTHYFNPIFAYLHAC